MPIEISSDDDALYDAVKAAKQLELPNRDDAKRSFLELAPEAQRTRLPLYRYFSQYGDGDGDVCKEGVLVRVQCTPEGEALG